ncbi:GDSL-like Lipase/Acylhydrolase [Maioricimonas rarisocia]|uniref:GDSL-like Lipase/Acylhydrolase n=1 Tax=Maioricimonas rarisocia TaxID=2528026 RepID=A0A517ZFB2_9PLAN|nr:SGNH/GDSL hydrolase family protein [Maioricimonas rarisocia]QDU41151.1 GDSL-like Lipase/Acylhydrolase [Maioricimonas rarisocia]
MRIIPLSMVLFACCLLLAGPAMAQEDAQKFPAPLPKLELSDGDSIVFLGDSITHQCLYTQYVEDYFYTRFPQMRLKLHNAGVGGARAWDALARFDEDVAAYKPKYVTILLGMNDGSYRPYDETVFQTYRQDMTELIGRLQSIDAMPIPMTPTMFDARAARMGNRQRDPEAVALYNSVLAYYGTWLRDVAQQQGFGFVDMWSPLNNITIEQRKTDPDFTLIRDAVHPGPDGQVVMATAIVNDLGLQRQLSNIRITRGADGEPAVRASGGEVSDLEFTDEGVSFTWSAKGLPWVLPEDAREGAKLTRLGHRLSREALEVHGLPAGRYTLTIDDAEVGRWSADALARHIELQENEKTPQYQQALTVAGLNKQRNEGPVRSLRGEWSQFQRYARTKRSVKENPGNEQLETQLMALEERIAGMDERVEGFNRQAKEFEDQIFEVNQPQPRRYVLRRVE